MEIPSIPSYLLWLQGILVRMFHCIEAISSSIFAVGSFKNPIIYIVTPYSMSVIIFWPWDQRYDNCFLMKKSQYY